MAGKDRHLRKINRVMFAIAAMVVVACLSVSDAPSAVVALPLVPGYRESLD